MKGLTDVFGETGATLLATRMGAATAGGIAVKGAKYAIRDIKWIDKNKESAPLFFAFS